MSGDYLDNVIELPMSRERWCLIHDTMWADCSCPGPHEDEDPVDQAVEALAPLTDAE